MGASNVPWNYNATIANLRTQGNVSSPTFPRFLKNLIHLDDDMLLEVP